MLSHVNKSGKVVMINVNNKSQTVRKAIAQCEIKVPNIIYNAVLSNNIKKGDVITTSRLAGIMGTKKTSDIIPMCHQINLDYISVDIISNKKNYFTITSNVETNSKTGVEMEALSAVNIASLTFYDMCKALSKNIIIKNIRLIEKTGGKSDFKN